MIRIFVLQRMLGVRGKKNASKAFEKGTEDVETILLSLRFIWVKGFRLFVFLVLLIDQCE